MDLFLDTPIKIEIKNGGKTVETLNVSLREYTKAEKDALRLEEKEFIGLVEKSQKHLRVIDKLETKIELQKGAEDFKGALLTFKELQEVEEVGDALSKDINEKGGDDFYEQKAKENFNSLVSGDGKNRLAEIAESKGYQTVMRLLRKEKEEVEKKPSGE